MTARELSGVREIFQNQIVAVVIQLYKFTKNHRIVYLQSVNFMICKLYLSRPVWGGGGRFKSNPGSITI